LIFPAGAHRSIAVNLNNEIYGFGSNKSGQLGAGKDIKYYSEPTLLQERSSQ